MISSTTETASQIAARLGVPLADGVKIYKAARGESGTPDLIWDPKTKALTFGLSRQERMARKDRINRRNRTGAVAKLKRDATSPKTKQDILRDSIAELHFKGATIELIAERVGRSERTVQLILGDLSIISKAPKVSKKRGPSASKIRVAERRDKVKALHAEGKAQTEIAKILGVALHLIASDCHRLGLRSVSGPHPKPSSRTTPEILRLRGEGKSRAEIAKLLGITQGAVGYAIKSTPISQRPALKAKSARDARRQKALEMRNSGMVNADIARALGISLAVVKSDFRAIGASKKNAAEVPASVQERRDAVFSMREQGATIGEICDALGVSRNTVTRDIAATNAPNNLPRISEKGMKRRKEATSLYRAGMSMRAIANHLCCVPETVKRDLIAEGALPPSPVNKAA